MVLVAGIASIALLSAPVPHSTATADQTPPGSSADQQLWRDASEIGNSITIERTRAARLQSALHARRYHERLSAVIARSGPTAKRADDLRRRLLVAWNESYGFLTRQWPVDPTRACAYQALMLRSVLLGDVSKTARQLAAAREDAASCLATARVAVTALASSNGEVEALAGEIDAALAEMER